MVRETSVALEPERGAAGTPAEQSEAVHEPAKVLRIGAMAAQLLAEVHGAPLDEAGRRRLRLIHDESIRELQSTLSPDLARELSLIVLPLDAAPSSAELRVAEAQLVGWLQGLVHGINAAILAQHVDAQAQQGRLSQPGPEPSALPRSQRAQSPISAAYL